MAKPLLIILLLLKKILNPIINFLLRFADINNSISWLQKLFLYLIIIFLMHIVVKNLFVEQLIKHNLYPS